MTTDLEFIGSINVEPRVILDITVEDYEGSYFGTFKEEITGSSTTMLHVSYTGLIREALDWAQVPHPPLQDIEDQEVADRIIEDLDEEGVYLVTLNRR